MSEPTDHSLLRVFCSEADLHEGRPLYEWVVLKAHELNLAGAIVLRGLMGFTADHRLHTAKVLRLSEDLPLVIEIVDTADHLARLLPFLDDALDEGMVTLEQVRLLRPPNANE
jgi:hypothetical protein